MGIVHRLCFGLLLAVIVTGCAVPPKRVTLINQFDAEEARKALEKGSNTIKGSALIRQRGGGVVTCAGGSVWLVPATAYAIERVRVLFGDLDGGYFPAFGRAKLVFDGEPSEYRQLQRRVPCDAQGYFRFDGVSDGRFYVGTVIVWKVSDYVTEGGVLTQSVAVSGGETKEIVLSPR